MVAKAYNKKVKTIPGRRPGMEDHLATKEQRPEVWKVVAKLGRPLQHHTGNV
jgi:hypothetical protein